MLNQYIMILLSSTSIATLLPHKEIPLLRSRQLSMYSAIFTSVLSFECQPALALVCIAPPGELMPFRSTHRPLIYCYKSYYFIHCLQLSKCRQLWLGLILRGLYYYSINAVSDDTSLVWVLSWALTWLVLKVDATYSVHTDKHNHTLG